jgi:hypothetical protein
MPQSHSAVVRVRPLSRFTLLSFSDPGHCRISFPGRSFGVSIYTIDESPILCNTQVPRKYGYFPAKVLHSVLHIVSTRVNICVEGDLLPVTGMTDSTLSLSMQSPWFGLEEPHAPGHNRYRLARDPLQRRAHMSFWQILVVIGVIVIPLILSIWMTLWTVEKRGRGPKPVYRQGTTPPAPPARQPATDADEAGTSSQQSG